MAHVRFEPMMMMDGELAERRRRLMASALLATTLCMGAGMLTWVGDKMGISAVTPPKNAYAVSFEVFTTPPPPAPPALPAGASSTDDQSSEPDPVTPPEPESAPLEVPDLDLDARPTRKLSMPGTSTGKSSGVPNGGRHGVLGGVKGAHCLIPPCLGTRVISDPPTGIHKKKDNDTAVQKPFSTVIATAVYSPNPDQKKLSRTPTGLSHRKAGKTTVAFCIRGGTGQTYDVRVRKSFGGDPEVDRICRETVAKWRFAPQKVAGKARSTCSKVSFDIRFD